MPPDRAPRLVIDVLVPARDAAATLPEVLAALPLRQVRSVVVVDNGSSDATAQAAVDGGAVVVREPRVGYGLACRRGVTHLSELPHPPDAVVFLAADGSDDPAEIPRLIEPLEAGRAELVIGTRAADERPSGGARTRVALGLIGAIYRHRFSDLGPFRAIRLPALVALGMRDPGAGWLVEMQVKALKVGLRIAEVPVSCRAAARARAPLVRQVCDSVESTGRVLFQIFRHATAR